jgi:hypothetical protein
MTANHTHDLSETVRQSSKTPCLNGDVTSMYLATFANSLSNSWLYKLLWMGIHCVSLPAMTLSMSPAAVCQCFTLVSLCTSIADPNWIQVRNSTDPGGKQIIYGVAFTLHAAQNITDTGREGQDWTVKEEIVWHLSSISATRQSSSVLTLYSSHFLQFNCTHIYLVKAYALYLSVIPCLWS